MDKIIYTKYSNERIRKFAIRTDICVREDNGRFVRKQACFAEGKEHIRQMERWYAGLSRLFEGTPFAVNRCVLKQEQAEFEYLTGRTLEERLDGLLLSGQADGAASLLLEYAAQVRRALSGEPFVLTPEFCRVFGDVELKGSLTGAPVTDIDMVVGNVLEQDGRWTLLDYEWTFDFPVPVDFVIYRILKYYMYGNQIRAELYERDLYGQAGVGPENRRAFDEMEENFQSYVRGDVLIMAKLYEAVSPGHIALGEAAEKRVCARGANLRFQVFFDRGAGFSPEDSYDILYGGARQISLEIRAGAGVSRIRLDPPSDQCLLWLKSAVWQEEGRARTPRCTSNGTELQPGLFAFSAEDAQLIFEVFRSSGVLKLELDLELQRTEDMFQEYLAARPSGHSRGTDPGAYTAKWRRTVDRGVAYFKKNGLRATAQRGLAKARLARPLAYEKWLARHRMDDRTYARMQEEYKSEIARIHVVTAEELPAAKKEDYYLLITKGGVLERAALPLYAQAVREHPGAGLFYCDSDRIREDGRGFCAPCLKPDFDMELLCSVNYIGAGFLVSGDLLRRVAPPEQGAGEAALYGTLLACARIAGGAVHVAKLLYHGEPRRGAAADSMEKKALRGYLEREKTEAQVLDGEAPGIRRIRYKLPEKKPLVSILIPNRDHVRELQECLESIRAKAGYGQYEILILENGSAQEETFSFYERAKKEYPLRVLIWEGEFNFSAINNFGAEQAAGEYLLFLNNDTKMISEGCLAELLNYGIKDDVGAVGARMYYPDGRVQHAGVIVGYGGLAGHAFEGMKKEQASRFPWFLAARQYSAVTAACMLVKKEVFQDVGGFCEEFGVAYNDIDLCLRLRRRGWKVIYTPYAELLHYESRTRGLEKTKEKAERIGREAALFRERFGDVLAQGDPCYNANLTLEKTDFSLRQTVL